MAGKGLHFDGLAELKDFFESLPDALSQHASSIVDTAAEETAALARDEYKEGKSGGLRKGVRVKKTATVGHVATATVINTSPHSHLYEEGSELRKTRAGVARGSMPARPVIRKIAPRKRRDMTEKLIEMVKAETGAVINRG